MEFMRMDTKHTDEFKETIQEYCKANMPGEMDKAFEKRMDASCKKFEDRFAQNCKFQLDETSLSAQLAKQLEEIKTSMNATIDAKDEKNRLLVEKTQRAVERMLAKSNATFETKLSTKLDETVISMKLKQNEILKK
jgi:vancomycin resistance protein YoaR